MSDADEPQVVKGGVVVDAVAVGGPLRGWEQSAALVKPNCLWWHAEFVCELTDAHLLIIVLDLDLWIKVYGSFMDVTLLYFDGCPHWEVADGHLRTLAAEIAGLGITRRVVDTQEEAVRVEFRGSPSIIVDGVDAFADADAPVGLSCRIYQTPNGSAGSPTLGQLRAALASRSS